MTFAAKIAIVAIVTTIAVGAASAASAALPKRAYIGSLILEKCMDSMYCGNLSVPVDHSGASGAGNASGAMMNLAFVMHFAGAVPKRGATGAGRQIVLMPSGGPGTVISGGLAQTYADSFSDGMRLGNEMDLLFVDQRGMGQSCGMWCPDAYQALTMIPFNGAGDTVAYAARIGAYRAECAAEMRANPALVTAPCLIGSALSAADQRELVIPFLGTQNAARDLDAIRAAAGYERVWLYGRSYGTAVAQVYAALFAGRVSGMIIDSALDTASPIREQDANLVPRRNAFLVRSLELCATEERCAVDLLATMISKGLFSYQRVVNAALLAALGAQSAVPAYGAAEAGGFVMKPVTRWHLEYAILNWEGSPYYRGDVARAIIKAAGGNRNPLLRMLWGAWGMNLTDETIDGEALMAGNAEYTTYPMVYGADYSYATRAASETAADRCEEYLSYGIRAGGVSGAMGTTYAMDAQGAAYNAVGMPVSSAAFINASLPKPSTHAYPILIVGPSVDPFCADTDAAELYGYYRARGPTARLILVDGPHVSAGKTILEYEDGGFRCVNSAVDAFVFGGATSGVSACTMDVPFPAYIPIDAPIGSTAAEAAMHRAVAEIVSLPEFRWYATDAATCDLGGSVSWVTDATGTKDVFTLANCSFDDGVVVNGAGTFDWNSDDLYTVGAELDFTLRVMRRDWPVSRCFTYTGLAGRGVVLEVPAARCA